LRKELVSFLFDRAKNETKNNMATKLVYCLNFGLTTLLGSQPKI